MNMEEARIAVQRAAAMMDRIVPGWHHRLNLQKLEMADCTRCALGQLFGSDVETGIAKEMYPELWEKKAATDGFTAALWGGDRPRDYSEGMLSALLEAQGEEPYRPARMSTVVSPFGSNKELKCLWAEEVATRIANETSKEAEPTA